MTRMWLLGIGSNSFMVRGSCSDHYSIDGKAAVPSSVAGQLTTAQGV